MFEGGRTKDPLVPVAKGEPLTECLLVVEVDTVRVGKGRERFVPEAKGEAVPGARGKDRLVPVAKGERVGESLVVVEVDTVRVGRERVRLVPVAKGEAVLEGNSAREPFVPEGKVEAVSEGRRARDPFVPEKSGERLGERVGARDPEAEGRTERDREGAPVGVRGCVPSTAAVPDLEGVGEGVPEGVGGAVPETEGVVVPVRVWVREGVGVEDTVAPKEGVAEQEAWEASPVEPQHPLVHRVGATAAWGQK